ncbi:MAG: TolC family protein [Verrucomicrobia bacterium]|nr:TolC family protein [Verrucomicrobiota bacterium]
MRVPLFALAFAGMSCTLIAGGESTAGYGSHPLTVDEAVQLALKQNPSILSQVQQIKVQKGLVFQAQSKLLPQLTMASNYSQNDNALSPPSVARASMFDLLAVPANSTGLIVNHTGSTPNTFSQPTGTNAFPFPAAASTGAAANQTWQVTLTVSQLIYDGGATIASRRAARINEDQAYYTLRDTIDTVVQTVRTQFYQIILNKALVQVQEESVNLLQSQLEDQKSRFEAGTVPQFNVLQAEGTLENQIPQLIAARNNYFISEVTLARTLGIPASRQYTTDNPLPVEGELGFSPIQYDLASALIVARANRPFLKAQRSAILASVENITVQAAGYKPTITADVGWEQRSNPLTNNLGNTLQGWFLGFQGSWNVFDGLLTYGRMQQARAQLEQAKVTYDDSVREVELEVATSVSNLRQAALTVDSAQTGVNVNLEALRLADERLAAGTGTQLDVLTAQQQLTTARSNLVSAQFSYLSSVFSYQQNTATETKYNDIFDDGQARPSTLTKDEAAKAARFRYNSPLDPGMPSTQKAKHISLTPPQGKVETTND